MYALLLDITWYLVIMKNESKIVNLLDLDLELV